ncbi:hypothetical protein LWI28_001258 [Acer negundo]|uniref:Major facilitator superfamily (MFS) profile domain-containing protein n=1 Tax=Acer negundo TaxID=4023 RepID=A0AAD5I8N6_ACENE|nr:hypothetical protein LWI28_001258 [Acer negundo]
MCSRVISSSCKLANTTVPNTITMAQSHETVPKTITMAQSHETVPNCTITMAQSHENISPKITESHGAAGIVGSVLEINKSHDVITTSFEEMFEQSLQGFGWAMFFQVILIALSAFFDSEQAFISIYTDGIPTWHCTNNASTTCNSKQSVDICKLHTSEWAWDEIPSKTIVSEWGLQCSNAFLRGLPASSHFAGTILGLFVLASLADSCLGRKKLLLYSCLMMSVTGIITILSNSVWIYSLLRFIAGFCRATMATSGIILLSEVDLSKFEVGSKLEKDEFLGDGEERGWFSAVKKVLSPDSREKEKVRYNLAIMARQSNGDALADSLLQNESKGNNISGEFEELLEQNLKGFSCAMFLQVILVGLSAFFDSQQSFISIYTDAIPTWHCINNGSTTCNSKHSTDICKLPTSEWSWDEILTKTIISEWGLQCSGVFLKGLPASSHFAGTILGVFLLASLADSWLGRKKLLLYSCLMMSVIGIITILSNNIWIYSLLRFIAGFCRATMATSAIILLSEVVGKQWRGRVGTLLFFFFMVVEMFPTCVRNFAASLARQAVTFGAVLSSLLNSLGSKNPYLSYGVFGLIVFCCGFFVLILPETRGTSLCDTMDEQEGKENIVHS